jgi:hypothetical protein
MKITTLYTVNTRDSKLKVEKGTTFTTSRIELDPEAHSQVSFWVEGRLFCASIFFPLPEAHQMWRLVMKWGSEVAFKKIVAQQGAKNLNLI